MTLNLNNDINLRKRITIILNDLKDINDFSNIVSKFESDIDVYKGAHVFDAKSIMHLISYIDLSKPVDVRIFTDDDAEEKLFIEKIERFKFHE